MRSASALTVMVRGSLRALPGRVDGIRRSELKQHKIRMAGPGRSRCCRPKFGLLLNHGERWRAPSTTMFKTCSFRVIAFLAVVWTVVPAQADLILHAGKGSSLANEKQASRDVKLYLKLVAQRSLNPAAFDHRRPFYGKLITDRSFFEIMVQPLAIPSRAVRALASLSLPIPGRWSSIEGTG